MFEKIKEKMRGEKKRDPYNVKDSKLELKDTPINMAEITRQHTAVYVIKTTIGRIKLKHLGKMRSDHITREIAVEDPKYLDMMREFDYLIKISQYPEGLNNEQLQKAKEFTNYMTAYTDRYVKEIYVEPKLDTVEELNALLDSLTAEEYSKMEQLHVLLTSPQPPSEVEKGMALMCKHFNLPLSKDLTGDNMTVAQFQILNEALKDETTEAREIMSKMG